MPRTRLHHGIFIEDRSDFEDRPFGAPPDVVLDLPPPPSVNRTRRYDFRYRSAHIGWLDLADRHVIAGKRYQPIKGAYELHITMSPVLRIDLDNGIKCLIDYLHRIQLVQDDSQRFLRKLTVEWGEAPEGCRVAVRGVEFIAA